MAKTYKDSNKEFNKDSRYNAFGGAQNHAKVKDARKPKFVR